MLLWLAVPAVTMAVTFTASLDRDTIGMGESATLTLKFEDGRPTTDISIPPVDGLSVNYIGPQSYSQTDLNTGKTLSSVSYVFNLTPGRAGQFVIPAITVNAEGQKLTSQPLTLTVAKAAPVVNPKIFFLKLVTPKTQVYIGEIVPLELQLFAGEQARLADMPHFKEEGFTLGKMLPPTQSLVPWRTTNGMMW